MVFIFVSFTWHEGVRFDNFTQENICLYANNCFIPRRSQSLPARAQRSLPSFLSRASRLSRVLASSPIPT